MLPHSLLCLLIASSSAAWSIPPPRIPRPATPDPIEPISPAPRPIEPRPNDRPNPEVPEVPDTNSPDSNTSNAILIPSPTTTSGALSNGQAHKSLADAVPVASSATISQSSNTALASVTSLPSKTARQSFSPTSRVTTPEVSGGAYKIQAMGLKLWRNVVGLIVVSVTTVFL